MVGFMVAILNPIKFLSIYCRTGILAILTLVTTPLPVGCHPSRTSSYINANFDIAQKYEQGGVEHAALPPGDPLRV